MTRSDFLRELDEMLELEPGTVTDETTLEAVNFDSLATLSLIALADEKLGLALDPARIAECQAVADLVALVSEKLG